MIRSSYDNLYVFTMVHYVSNIFLLIYFSYDSMHVEAEQLEKIFFFPKKLSAYLNFFHQKKNFKYDKQKGLIKKTKTQKILVFWVLGVNIFWVLNVSVGFGLGTTHPKPTCYLDFLTLS